MEQQAQHTVPLCVDLDGSLVRTDTLVESFLVLVKIKPWMLLLIPFWIMGGKASFKQKIAQTIELDVPTLPYHHELLSWLKTQKNTGRPLFLVTAANQKIAESVAEHLQIFEGVIASDHSNNIKGKNKRDTLDQRFGAHSYDYVGNDTADLAIWQNSRQAIIVNASDKLQKQAAAKSNIGKTFPRQHSQTRELLRAMRPFQWSKNLLLFVNLLMAHQFSNTPLLLQTLLAFIAFCLCSSSVYLLNDLLDLAADRRHGSKRNRPFASGSASLLQGLLLIPILMTLSLLVAWQVGPHFMAVLSVYFIVTLAYSFYLKRLVILDVITLATLYTLRIIAGASVAVVLPSFWLMAFSLFIFTSLAVVKRYAELKSLLAQNLVSATGRGYHTEDLNVLGLMGVASGFISILVLALYVNSPAVIKLYHQPEFIWLLCPLMMYWIARVWLLASRGLMDQDPVVFATRDRTSYLVVVVALLVLGLAL